MFEILRQLTEGPVLDKIEHLQSLTRARQDLAEKQRVKVQTKENHDLRR